MLYSSTENEKIKKLKKLQIKKYRDQSKQFLIETPHLIIEAFKAGYLDLLIVLENEDFTLDVETITVTSKVMDYLSQLKTKNKVMGVCHYKEEKPIGKKVLMLENIQDPGNLGTIIRTSVAFNVDTLIISNDTVDIYNDKVIRASEGMLFKLNIIKTDLKEMIKKLKNNNYLIIGTDVKKGKEIKHFKSIDNFAIIMGNEGKGLTEDTKKLCDEFIYIDMSLECESLNVAIATSIILYELR